MRLISLVVIAVLGLARSAWAGEAPAKAPPDLALFRTIYKELVAINTTDSTGDTVRAASAMAARLRAGGLPERDIHVFQSAPRKGDLVARLRGTGAKRPLLLTAHLDVVEARRADWAFDPFTLQEADGYFRGRGTIDDKAMAAIFVTNLIRYVHEGLRPERDIILALTADEELSDSPNDGARWLLANHRDLIDAELAINEGGSGTLENGKPVRNTVQLAEKVYQSYRLEARDPQGGGHSAAPHAGNPIYRLSVGLTRLAQFEFPVELKDVTRAYFKHIAPTETGAVGTAIQALLAGQTDAAALAPLTNNPAFNGQIRTTCVATLLNAGQAENALPERATATVNCRILPGDPVEGVTAALTNAINDPDVKITPVGTAVVSPPSPFNPAVMDAVERLTADMWPGAIVVPTMSAGYTDSRWLRNVGIAAYGVSGLFAEPGKTGVHGINEQVGVQQLYDSKEFLYRLVKILASS